MSSETGSPRCLNCGAELAGPFCAQCGQENTELRVSLRRLVKDFLAEQLGLESKVPTTLWTLLRHPGRLTKDYLAGRRVRSLLPLRLYLSASVVYFLLLSIAGGLKGNFRITESDRAGIDSSHVESPAKPRGAVMQFVRKRMKRFDGMSTQEVVKFFNDAFIHYMPNAVFVLLPVFTTLLYLLYRKTGRFFAEHLIFTLHIHAFAFVALTLSLLTPDSLDWIAPVWILAYLYVALKVVYGETRRKTIGKFAALLFSYMVIFQITMAAVLALIFTIA